MDRNGHGRNARQPSSGVSSSSIPRSPSSTMARSARARGPSSSATRPGSGSSSASPSTSSSRRLAGLLAEARAALGALRRCSARRPHLRPERDDRREHGRALARPRGRATRCSRRTSSTARATSPGSGLREPGALRPGADPLPLATRASRRGALRAASGANAVVYRLPHHLGDGARSSRSRRSWPARARSGLVTIVDGAHAPAQVPLDLAALGADFYARQLPQVARARRRAPASCTCGPSSRSASTARSSAGATRRAELLSSGSSRARATPPPLAVPAAIASRPSTTGTRCAPAAALRARRAAMLCELLGTEPIAPEDDGAQMASVRLPDAHRRRQALRPRGPGRRRRTARRSR